MKAIGIRAEPTEIYYAIVETNPEDPTDFRYSLQKLKLPIALSNDIPRQLSYIRTTLFSIICEYEVSYAGLRTAEGSAQTPSIFRMNIEGVIQELFSNSTIKKYFTGTFTSIAARVNSTSTEIKNCCKGKTNLLNVDKWNNINSNHRECLFAALASINYKINTEVPAND
ncbi:hypothetical protein [Neobacillus bataviensis]|uniref:hypothetical protein n=1 Tax=Neobacillus bataviensis TaxID=220685 RepID=UPI001CBD55B4|nr:hypothetical protein [Neobacillus bataviensis]